MSRVKHTHDVRFEPPDNKRLANLCGNLDVNIKQIEQYLEVTINNRGALFQVNGEKQAALTASKVLVGLYEKTKNCYLSPREIHLYLQQIMAQYAMKHNTEEAMMDDNHQGAAIEDDNAMVLHTRSGSVKANNPHQQHYLQNIEKFAVNFSVGPAGTGKTFLAVAAAVKALEREEVRRLILVRPAVEAGERLGFLPGDLSQKIDPYLRPLYDALYQLMGNEVVSKLVEKGVIEVLPLAYMRGRTLNDSFIILDEAQNTTLAQMKMFLTRIGFGSTAVITGDVTQIDLPEKHHSGLLHVIKVLEKVKGIGFTFFDSSDVVRHPLVQKIIEAYTVWEDQSESNDKGGHEK